MSELIRKSSKGSIVVYAYCNRTLARGIVLCSFLFNLGKGHNVSTTDRSEAFGAFDLLEPIKAHRFDDAAVDHHDARLVGRVGIEGLLSIENVWIL